MDDFEESPEETPDEVVVKRRPGRPKGSRNKRGLIGSYPAVEVAPDITRVRPITTVPFEDYTAPDPMAMVGRLYAEVDWGMTALNNEMKKGIGASTGMRISFEDTEKLAKVAVGLEKALVCHDRALKLMDKLKEHKTPAQLLEMAIVKVEGQDLATLSAIIKRLRDKRRALAPLTVQDAKRISNTSMEDAMEAALKDL